MLRTCSKQEMEVAQDRKHEIGHKLIESWVMNMWFVYTISTTLVNVNIFHNLKIKEDKKIYLWDWLLALCLLTPNWKGSQLVCNLSVFPSQNTSGFGTGPNDSWNFFLKMNLVA